MAKWLLALILVAIAVLLYAVAGPTVALVAAVLLWGSVLGAPSRLKERAPVVASVQPNVLSRRLLVVLGGVWFVLVSVAAGCSSASKPTPAVVRAVATPTARTLAQAEITAVPSPRATSVPLQTSALSSPTAVPPSPTLVPPTQTAIPRIATATAATPTAQALVSARVVSVVDGYSIRVLIGGREETVRYIGVDTPETVHPSKAVEWMGLEASEKNKQLVAGKEVLLEKDVSERDQYGRLLRYVYVGQTMINEELVRLGFAKVSNYPPDVKHADRFLAAQREARKAGRGLWGPTATAVVVPNPTVAAVATPMMPAVPTATITPPPTQAAPTPTARPQAGSSALAITNIDATGEVVTISNRGSADQDLTGWRLWSGPERNPQIYNFPAGFVLRAGATVRVHSFTGANSATDLYWGRNKSVTSQHVWNNSGDVGMLLNSIGAEVSRLTY